MSAEGAVPPSGTLTFLFTDVEGSTQRWESDPVAMRAALAAHDDVLRDAIQTHDGHQFKHTGDGVCAVFASPRCAVDAAVAAQRALALPVRMGLATGEAELRGDDYFGAVLNRAARVMATGHGGQVILADSTAVLLSGVDLLDLGRRRLRDVSVPIGLFQVRADGLRADFPPLRTLDATPGNLRAAVTSFVGRETEVDRLTTALRECRLVTLTGAGGVGKTRLALEIATRLAGEFPDGVWVFELASVTDPVAVPDAVAAVMGITQQPGKSAAETVADTLEGRVRLLVIDNCEHVLDAAAELVEVILARSTAVRILATSREGLGLSEEQVWPVPSLSTSAGTESAAVSLFVERAQHLVPDFSIAEPTEALAVTEICRRLDGLPLAIELAASRMASMSASEVRNRLDQRFRLLVGSRRGLTRHHTLRHTVAWSYDQFSEAERVLFERCSTFAGGFDLESACSVAGYDDEIRTLDLLDSLVRKSMLVADRSRRTRFSMLETIRQFAEERLIASGQPEHVRTAHAHYFASRVNDIMALWNSSRQGEAYVWFTTELANLRSAFRWAADNGDLDSATSIAVCATLLGGLVDNFEPVSWAEELIEPARVAEHSRLLDLYTVATQCVYLGRTDECVRYSEAGQRALRDGDDITPSGFEAWLGSMYMNAGIIERSIEWCRWLLARGVDPYGVANAGLVLALTLSGARADAMSAAAALIACVDRLPNPYARSFALLTYGMSHCDGDPHSAREAMRRGLGIAEASGNRSTETALANTLGRLEAKYGDPLDAVEYLVRAIRSYHDSGNPTIIRIPLAILAGLLHRRDRDESAAVLTGFADVPLTRSWLPEFGEAVARLRETLGERGYESNASRGASMSPATMVGYAFDQIDQLLSELSAVSN